jgi:imidazolonepropionase-like amidohydrolase
MPHGDYVSELELYVKQLGISADHVMRWVSVNGASLAKHGDDLGRVEAGFLADLTVIDGDPFADISALRKVAAVMKDGELLVDRLPHWGVGSSRPSAPSGYTGSNSSGMYPA